MNTPSAPKKAGPINTALISFGKASRIFHAPLITSLPAFALTKVVERHHQESLGRYPWVQVVRDTDTLLQDDSLDLVVITTPNDTHYDLARRCLLAGKHVVVDKPFVTRSEHARELIELAAANNRVLSVFQSRRWDGDFFTIKKLLSERMLGRVVGVESRYDRFRNYPRPGAWREQPGEGTGVFFDLAPHLVDQILLLFGTPQAVTAHIQTQRDDVQADDAFQVQLHYNRLAVTLRGGMLVRVPTPRFIINGTAGSFIKYGMDPQEEMLIAGLTPRDEGWGIEPEDRWGTIDTEINGVHIKGRVASQTGCYEAFYENVAAAITHGVPTEVTPAQMIATIRIIELAFESSRHERTIPYSE